jgi:hypothetical protein
MTESDSLAAAKSFGVLIALHRYTNEILRKCCVIRGSVRIKTGPDKSLVISPSYFLQILLGSLIFTSIFNCFIFISLFPAFSLFSCTFVFPLFYILSSFLPSSSLSFLLCAFSFFLCTLTAHMAIQRRGGLH